MDIFEFEFGTLARYTAVVSNFVQSDEKYEPTVPGLWYSGRRARGGGPEPCRRLRIYREPIRYIV